MLFPPWKDSNSGELVASAIIILAAGIKGLVELPELLKKLKLKLHLRLPWTQEPTPLPEKSHVTAPIEEIEVLSRKDLNLVLDEIRIVHNTLEKEHNSFEDTLACISVINLVLKIAGKHATDAMLEIIEDDLYAFLRHNNFPSKVMIGAMFEQILDDTHKERALQHKDLKQTTDKSL